MTVIGKETLDTLGHPNFEQITVSTLRMIVDREVLSVSEVELFNAVHRWSKSQCLQRELDVNGTNLRQVK